MSSHPIVGAFEGKRLGLFGVQITRSRRGWKGDEVATGEKSNCSAYRFQFQFHLHRYSYYHLPPSMAIIVITHHHQLYRSTRVSVRQKHTYVKKKPKGRCRKWARTWPLQFSSARRGTRHYTASTRPLGRVYSTKGVSTRSSPVLNRVIGVSSQHDPTSRKSFFTPAMT